MDGRALFVVRRGDSEILASQIIDFAAQSTFDLSFPRPLTQGELLYFDVITINPAVIVSVNQAFARYTSAASFSVPAGGQLSIAPALNFRPGAPDGSVTLTVLRNGAAAAQRTYTVTGGVVTGAPLLVDVNPNQTLTFAYTTANFPPTRARSSSTTLARRPRAGRRRRSAPRASRSTCRRSSASSCRRTRRITSR